jgi:hypothetical protein
VQGVPQVTWNKTQILFQRTWCRPCPPLKSIPAQPLRMSLHDLCWRMHARTWCVCACVVVCVCVCTFHCVGRVSVVTCATCSDMRARLCGCSSVVISDCNSEHCSSSTTLFLRVLPALLHYSLEPPKLACNNKLAKLAGGLVIFVVP